METFIIWPNKTSIENKNKQTVQIYSYNVNLQYTVFLKQGAKLYVCVPLTKMQITIPIKVGLEML